jgi:ankyrin repeat protein
MRMIAAFRYFVLVPTLAIAAEPAVIDAVRSGDLSKLQALVSSQEGMHFLGSQKQTALHEAASKCSVGAAQILLRGGIDRSIRDQQNRTAAMIALNCPASKEKMEFLGLLAPAARVRPDADESAPWSLHDAATRGKANVAEMLLKLGSDVNAVGSKGNRPLEIACRSGHADVAKILLDNGADITLVTSAGATVLHEAALGGSSELVEMILARGAIINATDRESGSTALHYGASFGRVDAVKTLLQHGAEINRKNNKGVTALEVAVAHGQTEVINVFRVRKQLP